jgi:hypothetical protein
MEGPFEKFVADHPRDPHPARLTWEAADQKHNRAHWLVIDDFGTGRGEAEELDDLNLMKPPGSPLISIVVNLSAEPLPFGIGGYPPLPVPTSPSPCTRRSAVIYIPQPF